MEVRRRVHIQLVLRGNQIGWYDSVDNKAKLFRAFIDSQTADYIVHLEREYQDTLDRLES